MIPFSVIPAKAGTHMLWSEPHMTGCVPFLLGSELMGSRLRGNDGEWVA